MLTPNVAEPISGDKLYQERARAALPLLVRQASAWQPIYYANLAEELGMPNPRNLNYVLGSIGNTLNRLGKSWGEPVPMIQCLVINQSTNLPGHGIGWFIKRENFAELSRTEQRRLVEMQLQKVFSYRKWPQVLSALKLPHAKNEASRLLAKASKFRGGGETASHRRLKEFASRHPELFRLPRGTAGAIEFPLPSGDCVDVMFRTEDTWVAVEVKSAISPEADLARGVFQCVKYQAVLKAMSVVQREKINDIRVYLFIESALSREVLKLKNALGVNVLQRS